MIIVQVVLKSILGIPAPQGRLQKHQALQLTVDRANIHKGAFHRCHPIPPHHRDVGLRQVGVAVVKNLRVPGGRPRLARQIQLNPGGSFQVQHRNPMHHCRS